MSQSRGSVLTGPEPHVLCGAQCGPCIGAVTRSHCVLVAVIDTLAINYHPVLSVKELRPGDWPWPC